MFQLSELKKNHTQILQADKLTTIGEITASISHEISNPLTIASGNLEVLEDCLEDAQEAVKFEDEDTINTCIQDIRESHERITAIIRNMKTFLHSENDKETREYVNLEEIILNSIKFLKPVLNDKNISVSNKTLPKKILWA